MQTENEVANLEFRQEYCLFGGNFVRQWQTDTVTGNSFMVCESITCMHAFFSVDN